jgi:peptidoglycan/xylan/chitin deacetylase (PgdA/CDA1 family)
LPEETRLLIFNYHAVVRFPLEVYNWCFLTETLFRRQMQYLKRRFKLMPLSQAVEQLSTRTSTRPIAVITFDDGFQNNYEIAFPILRAYGIPATFFLVTGVIDTSSTLWFCQLHHALIETHMLTFEWKGRRFDLATAAARARASSELGAALKTFPQPHLLAELHHITCALGRDERLEVELTSPYRMLSRQAISEMSASGLAEFGAHTHSHSILSSLSAGQAREEIEQSITAIGTLTGQPCRLFAYPNGRAQDYDASTTEALQVMGIDTAVTAIAGYNTAATPRLELRRYGIGADVLPSRFRELVEGSVSDIHD